MALSPRWRRHVRRMKYGVVAPLIAPVVRRTSLLDGAGAPPPLINYAGAGDFHVIGRIQTAQLVQRAKLGPETRVLDIGSGIGRTALALAERFPQLPYRGFDVVRYGVEWSRKALRRHPSFGFDHVDVRNDFYNPRGAVESTAFRFPYPDDSFDLAVATSVFTHLVHGPADRYLSEAARVVRPGGRIYLTTFLYDPPWPSEAGHAFAHPIGEAFCESLEEPEMAVAYAPEFWTVRCERLRLRWAQTFKGSWREGTHRDRQDAIVFQVGR